MIWAQDTNNAIGRNGTLPWHFSEDLKNFKKLTMGHVIIMGRKTWDSLPFKPLPNRQNIVISSNTIDDVETYNSIDACIKAFNENNNISDIFIIGGMSIYKFFYKHATTLHITFIDKKYDNTDTFFPIGLDVIKKDFNLDFKDDFHEELSFTRWIRK